jgi:hypothetical protein
MEVLVFRTSVKNLKQVKVLSKYLNVFGMWNFDLEDCDKILRIECQSLQTEFIINLMHSKGFECNELE